MDKVGHGWMGLEKLVHTRLYEGAPDAEAHHTDVGHRHHVKAQQSIHLVHTEQTARDGREGGQ